MLPWDVPFPPPGCVCQPLEGTRLGEGHDSWDTELVQCLLLQFRDLMLNSGSDPSFQQLSLCWLRMAVPSNQGIPTAVLILPRGVCALY